MGSIANLTPNELISPQSPDVGQKIDPAKLDAILKAYGILPLQDSAICTPKEATAETILAMFYLASLTSARKSYKFAYNSVKCLIEADYHDINKLKASSWREQTEILTEGGYTRYREKTATAPGELANLIEAKYDKDLKNLRKQANFSPKKIRTLIQENG